MARARGAVRGGRPGPGREAGGAGSRRGRIKIEASGGLLRPLKTAESVARDIVRDIIDHGMQPGDALVSEAVMLDQYRVSRESLREGLRLLEVQGLISIRRGPGGGPVVGTVDPANLGRVSTLFFQMSGASYEELFQAWVITECTLAELAARNPDAAAREAAMAPFLAEPAPGEDEVELESFVEGQISLHAAIARLANNRVIELTFQVHGLIVSHHLATVDDPREVRDRLAHDHHELARTIVSGHARRARELMEAHILGVAAFHRERLGDQLDECIEWL